MNNKWDKYLYDYFENLRGSIPLSDHLVINAISVCFASYLGIRNTDVRNRREFSKERLFDKMREHLRITGNNQIVTALNILEKYIIIDKEFEIITEKFLGNKMFSGIEAEIIDCIADFLIKRFYPVFETPDWLNHLAVALINPIVGTFYDGVAGIGSTAIMAHKHSKGNNGKLKIFTQEIFDLAYAISIIRIFLGKIREIEQKFGNTLTEPQFFNINDGERKVNEYDFSIMFPPFGKNTIYNNMLINDQYNRFSYGKVPRSNSDWLFVMHQIASLKEDGKGVISVFTGSLFNELAKEVRTNIIDSGVIECIITLPTNLFSYTSTTISLIVINKAKKRESNILMIDMNKLITLKRTSAYKEKDDLLYKLVGTVTDIYNNRKEEPDVSKIINLEEIEKGILLPNKYINKATIKTYEFGEVQINDSVKQEINWINLNETGKVYNGLNSYNIAERDDAEGDVKIVKLSDVQDGQLDLKSLGNYKIKKKVDILKYRIHPNDILISCKGLAIKDCIVPEHEENILLSLDLIGLRVDTTRFDPRYIKNYLESPLGLFYIESQQMGSSITMLNVKDLSFIPIPYIPLENQVKICDELEKKEQEIHRQMQRLSKQMMESKWNYYYKIGIDKMMKLSEENAKC